MRLYYHPVSVFSRRVRVALLEKDLHAEEVEVDLFQKEQFEPEYLAINPYGRVPALDDGGLVLYESTVILEYLEATRPEPALLPEDRAGRALASLHLKLCDVEFAPNARTIIRPKRFFPPETWRHEEMARASKKIQKHLDVLEEQFPAGEEFLVGGRFTIVDAAYLPLLHFLALLDVDVPPKIAAWAERLAARPSALATIPAR